ncbi:MAG: lysostaphin resistance A-like protein [Planctomycetota bacterium]
MNDDTRSLLKLATLFYVVVGLAAWGWAAWFDHPLFGERSPTALGMGYGVAAGLVVVALCHVAYNVSKAVRRASDMIGRFFGPVTTLQALWLALISGFVEEIGFRGALWPQLGLVGGALFFGLCHTIPARALAGYPVFAFFAGLILGHLREATGSVWPAVACHVTVNALNIAWLGGRQRREPAPAPAVEAPPAAPAVPDAEERIVVPEETGLGESFPVTIWRYDLRVEPTGTDRRTLPECLEHEDLALFKHVPRETVFDELRKGLFVFSISFDEPFTAFPADLAAISAYLFETVTGLEVAERHVDETTTDDVRAWKIVAQRGEWVKVPLLIPPPETGRFILDPDLEDTEVLAAHWNEYPRWFQDGMRFKYPKLRDL